METQKQKQIVVNVSEESKTKINSLKEKFNVSDKEFIAAILVVLENTADETIQNAVNTVVAEKQAAKVAAKIAKKIAEVEALRAQVAAA